MTGKREALLRIRDILYNIKGISYLHTEDVREITVLENEIEKMVGDMINIYTANRIHSELHHRRHLYKQSA